MSDTDEKTISVPEVEEPTAPIAPEVAASKSREAAKTVAEEAAAELTKQIDALKSQAAREKAAREEAERRAQAAEARAVQTEGEAKSSTMTAIANAIEARNGALESAKAQLASQWSEGDFVKAAETQTRIATLTGELQRLGEAKDYAEAQAKAPPPPPARTAPVTDVDEFVRTARLPPKSAAWLKEHPEALQRQKRLALAHDVAVEEAGFETPEYFRIIEKEMGLSSPSVEVEDDAPPVRATQRRPPAAPPSSSASATRGKVEVRMNAEMRRAAEISGISEEEYARNYLLARKQGLIN